MKTVYRTHYGPPEALRIENIDKPEPRAGEVLVRVHATTVNRTDCGGLWGRPFVYRFFAGFPRPRHAATGTDFAGEIVAVGSGVTKFEVGDRVFGFDDNGAGTHREYATYPVSRPIAKIPSGVSYETAAASLEGAHYALNFINKVSLQPGQRVLVYGATGAIGSAAVQLLKQHDVHVTAVCGSEHVERVAGLGPDRVIAHDVEDCTQGSERYDFFFDAVGKRTFGEARRVLTPRGIYISSELGPRSENIFLSLVGPFSRGQKVVFPFPYDIEKSLAVVSGLLARGAFRPLIDRRYSIEQIPEAIEYVASGQKIGNVILALA
jgi:NADPH:quinone reductase-like Zn-dependent oxidoreductase